MPKYTHGFTLVELLVVISIISILAIIGITIYSGVGRNARDAKRRGDINAIVKVLEIHYRSGYCFPTSGHNYCPPQPGDFAGNIVPEDPFDSPSSRKCYIYLNPTGAQPLLPNDNCYGANRSADVYKICADLESDGDWDGTGQDYCVSNQQ